MASDYPSHAGTNGTNGTHASSDGNFSSVLANNTQSQSSTNSEVPKEEVAWYFVEQYYRTLSGSPEKLYLFFNKRSQYVSGTEAEKISVAVGQKSISERIKDMDFRETKVRVTNVDSQASDSNTIVIQVIGEMTTKSEEPKKFVQTFVLASQTNGYFVLNDIFRYIADEEEEDEPVEAEQEQSELIHKDEPEKAEETIAEVEQETAAPAVVADDKAIEEVDHKLEEVAQAQESSAEPETNGVHAGEAAAPAAATEETKASVVEAVAEETIAEPEKPKDPVPSPKAAPAQPKAAPAPSAPPKPAVPKSWAQLAAGNKAAQAAAAAAPSNNAQANSTPSTQPKPAQTSSSQPTQAPAAAPAPASAAPAREPSPVDSQKTGSEGGGWQMAGDGHSRGKARAPAAPAQQPNDGRVRAYVKNVYQSVNADELKAHLSQFGEVVYFDVSRPKNSAFIEFSTRAAFEAALAANPHKIGNDTVFIEERRPQGGPFRGGAPRGRGGFEGQGRGGRGGGAPRGNFQPRGDRGGRGGGSGASRGRGAPAAA